MQIFLYQDSNTKAVLIFPLLPYVSATDSFAVPYMCCIVNDRNQPSPAKNPILIFKATFYYLILCLSCMIFFCFCLNKITLWISLWVLSTIILFCLFHVVCLGFSPSCWRPFSNFWWSLIVYLYWISASKSQYPTLVK